MPPQVIWLDARATRRRETAGGKGSTLATLLARRFPVPPGFVIPTWVFRDECLRLGLDVSHVPWVNVSWLDAARARMADAGCPADLEGRVARALARLGGARVAVRSSFVAEDGTAASFAGQLLSVLDVAGHEDALRAVRHVWASVFQPALIDYVAHRRAATLSGLDSLAVAVVIQQMVTPRAAGVAFSVDPVTGGDRVVVEAVPGVAAGLVAGRDAPERYVVDERDALTEVARPEGRPPALADDDVMRVARLARDVARELGHPQDIEWAWEGARLHLLQARPITSLAGQHVYSRRMVGDMCPGLVKPLLWSTNSRSMTRRVFGRVFAELTGVEADFAPLIRRIRSRMYVDMTFLGQWLEHIGLPANFFEVVTRDEPIRGSSRLRLRLVRRLPRFVRFAWRHGRSAPAIEAFLARHPAEAASLAGGELARLDARELSKRIDRLLQLHGETQWWVFTSAMNMSIRSRLLQRFAATRAPEVASADLLRGFAGLKALEPNAALRRIALEQVPRNERTVALLLSGDDAAIRASLTAESPGRALVAAVDAFLARFGFLSANGTDFTDPTWIERPGPIWCALGRLTREGAVAAPDEAHVAREAGRAAVARRCGPLTRVFFRALLDSAARYLVLREGVSVQMTLDAYRLRQLFRELGDRLVRAGHLRHPEDLFLLYYDELESLVRGPGDVSVLRGLIEQRREELVGDQDLWPPDTVCGDQPGSLPSRVAEASDVLVGIPGSAGTASGRARVVLDPSTVTGDLGRGDVLVVPFSDVGWTPLLATVGAVVAEVGGQLSHTAIVAREYGLPTVVGVRGATRLIGDGQRITVDGTRGRVYLQDRAAPAST